MRNFMVLLLSVFIFSNLRVQAQESVLHLQMFDKTPFSIVLDDIHFKDIRISYTIKNVPHGVHLLKVIKPRANRKTGRIIFADYVRIPEGKEIFAYIDSDNLFRVHDAISLNEERPTKQRPDDPYIKDNPSRQDISNNQSTNPTITQPDNVAPVTASPGMNVTVFQTLKSKVREQAYDDARLDLVKQSVSREVPLNCEQLGEIIDVFSFEAGKLDLVKFVYPYLTDKDQLPSIHNRFKFQSSLSELSKLGNK
mgnify:CR=1 FL=1